MASDDYAKGSGSLSKTFALLTILIGLVSVVGWVFDVSFLKAIIPQLTAIKFNTAFCILVLGLSACSFAKSENQNKFFNKGAAVLVFLIAFTTLLQYTGDYNWGIDEFIFKDTALTDFKPGRMAAISAVILILSSVSIFLRSADYLRPLATFIQVSNLFLALLALLGYLYGASGLLTIFQYKSISPQAVAALFCLNLSLLLSDKNSVIVRPFLSSQNGGVIGRKFLLTSILTLVVIGFGVRKITQHFHIDASIDGVVVVTLSLLFFSFFIWVIAQRLNSMDLRLAEKHKALEALNSQLEQRVKERAEELISSEKKFRALFEGAYDGILVVDETGRIKMVNKQLAEKFGYAREELVGEFVEKLIPERFRSGHVEKRKNFAMNAHPRAMGAGLDLFGLKKDGSEFPVDISLNPTVTEEGLSITATIRDITERKKFEEQQKFLAEMGKIWEESFNYDEKLKKLSELIVSKIADICVIKVVEDDKLIYEASATNHKDISDEFEHFAINNVMPGRLGSPHVLQTGEPLIIEDVQSEIINKNAVDEKMKKRIAKFGGFSYAVLPLISRGHPVGTLILSVNNNDRKKISKEDTEFLRIVSSRCAVAFENAKLQKYSRLAEVVTNNLPSMIAYWGKNEVCQFANYVYLDWFGQSPAEIIGKKLVELLGPELYQKNRPHILAALNGERQQFERDLIMQKTGEVRHTNVTYIPDVINGSVAGFFVLVVDVTDMKQAQLEALSQKERAEQAVQVREEVLAVVSHDLKNPLSAVRLSTHILSQEEPIEWPRVRESAIRILRSVKQMEMLISDLLDFAKMQSSTFALELSDENPNEIIQQVADSFQEIVKQKEITLEVNLPKKIKPIACDSGRVVQVLSNLIGNSVKFTSVGGKIIVTASDEERNLLISVNDNGPGMSSEQLPHVFDRFWQGEKTKKLGSGLGLSIAKSIVMAHNGKIWVESELGTGTTFFFTIPYSKKSERLTETFDSEEHIYVPPNVLAGTHILLVDDSEDNVVFVKMILQQAGAEISVASTGREALKVIRQFQPDLIITDIEMPDGNGFQLLAEVRKALGENLPVISFSAHSTGAQYEKIKNAGFDGNILKPIKPESLVNEVSRVLNITH